MICIDDYFYFYLPCRRNLAPGEAALRPEEQALLDRICEAYYLPAWCSVVDYEGLFREQGLQAISLTFACSKFPADRGDLLCFTQQ